MHALFTLHFRSFLVLGFLLATLFLSPSASAQVLYWGTSGSGLPSGGTGNWNTTSPFWTQGQVISYGAWANVSSEAPVAEFGGTGGIVTLATNISAGGLTFDTGGYVLNSQSGSQLTLTTESLPLNAGFSPVITIVNAGDVVTINAPIVNTVGLTVAGAGTLALTGNDTGITDSLAVEGGATLILYSATGSLATSNSIYLGQALNSTISNGGAGSFIYDNTGATGATSQSLGFIDATSGDSVVQINNVAGQNMTLNFSQASRFAGATLNLVVNGANGSTSLITLGGSTGFLSQGTFFNGSNYAYNTSSGVRGINYGVDASSFTTEATTSIGSGHLYVQTTGAISSQATGTFTTLNIDGANNFTLANSAVLTVNGILKSGDGASAISGGTSIKPGSNKELVIRTDLASDALTISTPIVANGTNALTKSGAGTLILSGNNTYNGQTYIDGGVLSVSTIGSSTTAGALGKSNAAINIQGGTLEYTGTTGTTTRAINTMVGGGGIDIASGTTLTIASGSSGANTGVISDALIKTGSGTLVLGGANDNSGFNMVVDAGMLELNKSSATFVHALSGGLALVINSGGSAELTGTGGDQIYDNADVQINGTGVFNMNNESEAWDGLSGNGILTNTGSSTGTLTLGANGDGSGGNRDIFSGSITGKVALITGLLGAGTQTLSGSSTYTGGTTVDGGTLLINNTSGSGTGTGAVKVNSGATLGGHGFIGGATEIKSGSILSPSASSNGAGSLTFTSGLQLDRGATLSLELGGNSDEILIKGGIFKITGTLTLNLFSLVDFNPDQSYILIDWTGATPSGVSLSNFILGTSPTGGAGKLALDGNTLVYETTTPIPEPSTIYILLFALLGFGFLKGGFKSNYIVRLSR